MRRNNLYTVTKGNKRAFIPRLTFGGLSNTFDGANNLYSQGINSMQSSDIRGNTMVSYNQMQQGLGQPGNTSSNSWMNSKAAAGVAGAVGAMGAGLTGLVGSGYSTGGVGEGISTVGNAVGDVAMQINPVVGAAVKVGSSLIGGLWNRTFGVKENKANTSAARESAANKRAVGASFGDALSTTDIMDLAGNMTDSLGFSNTDLYKGGWTKGAKRKARKKARKLINAESAALAMQNQGLVEGVDNVMANQYNDVMGSYFDYGGMLNPTPTINIALPVGTPTPNNGALNLMQQSRYLDSIDKRTEALAKNNNSLSSSTAKFADGGLIPLATPRIFAGGGLEASFLDEFGSDPIGAAVRYNRGLEQLAAQEEAAEAARVQEAAALEMQKRVANLETQNLGLQAQLQAQLAAFNPTVWYETPIEGTRDIVEEIPVVEDESSLISSQAVPMTDKQKSTWKYIEDRLKKSGKFNAIQIEGIKRNLQRESSLDPTIVGDGGAAFGLGQWHGNRQPKDRSLAGQTQHLIDTLANYDGREHWIGKGNYEGFFNARTPEEAHYYLAAGYERPEARITARLKRESDMSLKNQKAFGGELGTNGTDWSNGLLWVGAGGSHEENPFEGVPMGVDAEGIPNLVEEGETVYNDYVFSNRLEVPQFMYKELGLGGAVETRNKRKNRGLTFAEASKKLARESEQRPNDPISQDGLQASLAKLAEVQEAERMRKRAEDYTEGLQFACGGKLGRKYSGLENSSSRLVKNNEGNSVYTVDDRNIMRRIFGDNAFTEGFDNIAEFVEDPVEYIAGDQLDELMNHFSTWSEPKLQSFFENNPRIAEMVVNAGNALAVDSDALQAGRGAIIGKTAAKMGKKYFGKVVNSASKVLKGKGVQQRLNARTSPSVKTTDLVPRGNTSVVPRGSTAVTPAQGTSIVPRIGTGITPVGPTGAAPASLYTTTWTTPLYSSAPWGIAAPLTDSYEFQESVPTTFNGYTGAGAEHGALLSGVLQDSLSKATNDAVDNALNLQFKGTDSPSSGTVTGVPQDDYDPSRLVSLNKQAELAYTRPAWERGIIDKPTFDSSQISGLRIAEAPGIKGNYDDGYRPYQTWMRYAPVIGSGLMTLTDALGLTNKADYTYADKLEAAANQAGVAPQISYKPIGDYLKYEPMDIWAEQNRLNANARATDRAVQNNAGPLGSQMAGLLANGYNNQIASGELYRKALEYNNANRAQTADFNRRTNMFNSQMDLEAQMANARYTQAAKQMGLSGLAQAAAMREAIDNRVGAARTANLTNFLNSLGNIGRENFALNQINTDKSRNYRTNRRGAASHKRTGK